MFLEGQHIESPTENDKFSEALFEAFIDRPEIIHLLSQMNKPNLRSLIYPWDFAKYSKTGFPFEHLFVNLKLSEKKNPKDLRVEELLLKMIKAGRLLINQPEGKSIPDFIEVTDGKVTHIYDCKMSRKAKEKSNTKVPSSVEVIKGIASYTRNPKKSPPVIREYIYQLIDLNGSNLTTDERIPYSFVYPREVAASSGITVGLHKSSTSTAIFLPFSLDDVARINWVAEANHINYIPPQIN